MTELQQAKARNEHAAWAKAQDDEVTKHIPELADPERAAAIAAGNVGDVDRCWSYRAGAAHIMERRGEARFA